MGRRGRQEHHDPSIEPKFNQPQRKVGEKLAACVRELGVDDPNVSPNHGWRLRFKTTARRNDVIMDREVREGMAGHAAATVGEAYGRFRLAG